MKIDWKEVAASKGYSALRSEYIEDITRAGKSRTGRRVETYREKFYWIISRVKHFAHVENRTFIEVLDEWEADREESGLSYNGWFFHYDGLKFKKQHSNCLKRAGIKQVLKFDKQYRRHENSRNKQDSGNRYKHLMPKRSKERKVRWEKEYKAARKRRGF